MIRVLFGAGTAAAANGITADVDVLLDAGAAGSAGDDFTVHLTLDEGLAVGDVFSTGLDESVVSSIDAGLVTAGVVLNGSDLTTSLAFNAGVAPAAGFESSVTVSLNPGDAEGGVALPAIGDAFEGGFYAGLISHTADGVATHALIVAPRATGATGTGYTLTTMQQWKTSGTTTAGTTSEFDGAANTAAMVTAGIADHPAAQFCVNLSISGFTDWYFPSRLELDIAYENLKPTSNSNSTSFGVNDYSVPKRTTNYTTTDPAQTSVGAFQSTGAEAFVSEFHHSSTENGPTGTWGFSFFNANQLSLAKTNGFRVRAFRKIAV
jgi:hypothetical protein